MKSSGFLDLLAEPAFRSWLISIPFIFLWAFSSNWRKVKLLPLIVGVCVGLFAAITENIKDHKNYIGLPIAIMGFLVIGFIVGLIGQLLLSVAFESKKSVSGRWNFILPRGIAA